MASQNPSSIPLVTIELLVEKLHFHEKLAREHHERARQYGEMLEAARVLRHDCLGDKKI
jgi:hypothetical protein